MLLVITKLKKDKEYTGLAAQACDISTEERHEDHEAKVSCAIW